MRPHADAQPQAERLGEAHAHAAAVLVDNGVGPGVALVIAARARHVAEAADARDLLVVPRAAAAAAGQEARPRRAAAVARRQPVVGGGKVDLGAARPLRAAPQLVEAPAPGLAVGGVLELPVELADEHDAGADLRAA